MANPELTTLDIESMGAELTTLDIETSCPCLDTLTIELYGGPPTPPPTPGATGAERSRFIIGIGD